jgi:predicted transcriptional regulator
MLGEDQEQQMKTNVMTNPLDCRQMCTMTRLAEGIHLSQVIGSDVTKLLEMGIAQFNSHNRLVITPKGRQYIDALRPPSPAPEGGLFAA